jgi:hypothetical protein
MTHYIVWSQEAVDFRTYTGQYWDKPPASALVHRWTYTGQDPKTPIPPPGQENIRFNLWLFNGEAPLNGQSDEVIIENFVYLPPCSPIL